MKKLFIALGLLITLAVIAIAVLPSLIPSSVYKEKIEQQISASLGRDVVIAGDVKLRVFPSIRAKADNVTIANADGFTAPAFASMDSLEAKVKLFPLFKKQVVITQFTLVNPQISLEKTKDGRVNWAFGNEAPATKPAQSTAFARDGRYTDLQISLGTFSLKNGQVNYTDAQKGTAYSLANTNMKMTMPGMDKPVSLEGDLVFNKMAMDVELRLDTPKSFLNGETAPFTAKLKSDLISLSAQGKFTPSTIITFDIDFDSDIPSIAKLNQALGIDNPYSALTETAKLKGALSFDGVNLTAKNADVMMRSDMITTNFKGDFSAGTSPSASGDLDVNIANPNGLQKALGFNYPQAAALNTVTFSSKLSTNGTVTQGSNVALRIKGDQIDAGYNGNFTFDKALSLDGNFNAAITSVNTLMAELGMSAAAGADIIGDFSVKGRAAGLIDKLSLTGLEFKTEGAHLTARYDGDVKLGSAPALNGNFQVDVPSVKTLAAKMNAPLAYADATGSFTAKGTVGGTVDALSLTGIDAALSGGILNLQFTGNAQTGAALTYDGKLNADITSLRALAALGGTVLAPSTDKGDIYGPFSLSGDAKGNAKTVAFTNANLSLDALRGTGNFAADLSAGKPNIDATLNMSGLDLRPYQAGMAAQNPTGEIQPWSEDPLNFAALNLFNGKVIINTPSINMDRMEMGQSTITTTFKDGVMKTNIPKFTLYGGTGDLDMTLNARGAVPQVAFDFTLGDVDSKSFLGAAAGFTKLSGNTGTTMSFRGAGNSQAQIMRSLGGNGNFELSEGVLTGIDVAQFVSGIDVASLTSTLQSGQLPAGIGAANNTPFNKLDGLFTVNGGVVTVGDFSLDAQNVRAEGGGTLDLGNQTVNFSLRPRLIKGSGFETFGVPLKFSGGFGSIKAGLDTDMLGKVVAARAKAELQDQVTDRIGGELGGIVGGVIGGQNPPGAGTGQDPVGSILGGILGETPEPEANDNTPQTDDTKAEEDKSNGKEEPEEKSTEDEIIDNVLDGLFGGD